jgi:prepilin-type N-terminal cleavage/methylation domain-containing protein
MNMPAAKRRIRAFTMLELIVTILIAGIIVTIAITNFSSYRANLQAREAGKALDSMLQFAKQQSGNAFAPNSSLCISNYGSLTQAGTNVKLRVDVCKGAALSTPLKRAYLDGMTFSYTAPTYQKTGGAAAADSDMGIHLDIYNETSGSSKICTLAFVGNRLAPPKSGVAMPSPNVITMELSKGNIRFGYSIELVTGNITFKQL